VIGHGNDAELVGRAPIYAASTSKGSWQTMPSSFTAS